MTSMIALSICSAVIMAAYLITMRIRYGAAEMISYTYYQLGKYGWIFPAILFIVAFTMMLPVLSSEYGFQPLVFIGLVGFIFVGAAPNYMSKDDLPVHKTAAITAAAGCVGWSLTADWIPTAIIAAVYMDYLAVAEGTKFIEDLQETPEAKRTVFRPWYWAELAAIADTFATYWYSCYIS